MNFSHLLEQVKQHVFQYFKAQGDHRYVYHNLSHTEAVAAQATSIASHYQLNERDIFIIITAAWFHDTGYFTGDSVNHEARGADLVAHYLRGIAVDEDIIAEVGNCILATRMPQAPKNLNEQIVCDADLYHFGTDQFPQRNKLMRKEAEWRLKKKISKEDWRQSTILVMEAHQFHTA